MKFKFKNLPQTILLKLFRRRRYRSAVRSYGYPVRKHKHQDGGFVLVVVIAMLLILTSLLPAFVLLAKLETSSTKAATNSNTGFYTAETGLNLRAKEIQDKFVGYERPSAAPSANPQYPRSWQDCLDNDNSNDGSGDFICKHFNKQNNNQINDQDLITYVKEDPDNPSSIRINEPSDPFTGLSAQEYRYDVTSVAVNSNQRFPTAIQTMRFKSRLVPLFQFLMFYRNDLDFSVPPDMSLNGPIHTNGNLYLNAGSNNTLTINGQVSMASTLYRGAKIGDSCTGTVRINASSLDCNSGSKRRSYNQSGVSSWNNAIRVGIDPLTVPAPGELDPIPGRLYWDKADLRVVLKIESGTNIPTIEVRNQSPINSVNAAATNSLRTCSNPLISTTLRNKASGPPVNPNYIGTDTVLNVNSAAGFREGDVVIVGTDYDSNVIAPGGVNIATNRITLRRQLGHSYQTGTIASTGNTIRKAIVSTSNTFYNYREKQGASGGNAGSYIRMLNVDVQGLLNCIQLSVNNGASLMGLNPNGTQKGLDETSDGGLVLFLTVDGPNANTDVTSATSPNTPNSYGIRLYNGKYLYSNLIGASEIQGLTVVSDQAVYIQGDYNMKDDPNTPLPLDEGDDPTTPLPRRERWRPAAILADTINVLSNAWRMDDSNSRGYVGNVPSSQVLYNDSARTPTETWVNAAFLSGTEITGGVNGTAGQDLGSSSNSGGVNNYPRFHEHWNSDVPFNYKGSFVSLNRPRRVNSPFCGSALPTTCNIYTPPIRNWDYDTAFSDAANLPPLTPRAVYLRQEVFSRNFNR